ncbi:uncharacterized protein PHACADRAFT_193262 [Phanerochaete carnosa HHB-10118-sp]|uniref:Uncharacterized protein n=1 Tax=Phanerochaete carnosa (strain HHB-10118-sp) TaxID=650164 RepID=K5WFQ1_PHACS|nr:uncharacterized protein PHACADRAFT_193262 [Phanerochaete carnosa HHB-10118-sp]EKM58140.1 hypothetical protein PHACADRAFT_193262 [Phanerochaete carnosa HHB-10118-sp]
MRSTLSVVLLLVVPLALVAAAPPPLLPCEASTEDAVAQHGGLDKRNPAATIWGITNMCVAGGRTAHVTIEDVENRARQ